MKNFNLINGDMLEELDKLDENSIDCIITDPPYELNFMGKEWDNTGIAFNKNTWEKCLRVLKPGGHLLAFAGSRTMYGIGYAIQQAGFEIRDTIMWLYGCGFPKSMNIGLAIDKKTGVESKVVGIKEHCKKDFKENNLYAQDEANKNNTKCFGYGTEIVREAQNEWKGWGTCLKPSFEPIIVARKSFKGSLVDNVIEYGVGGINIDECRVELNGEKPPQGSGNKPKDTVLASMYKNGNGKNGLPNITPVDGRFPANTILTYDDTDYDEVCGGFPIGGQNGNIDKRYEMNNQVYGDYGYCNTWQAYNDSGSASRYFYCAKATSKDRDEGLESFDVINTGELQGGRKDGSLGSLRVRTDGSIGVNPYAGNGSPKRNIHPTVKPTELMQWLVRLVAPKGAVILDPFMGSGSTGKAIAYENNEKNKEYKFIGIEQDKEYCDIANARIKYALGSRVVEKVDIKTGETIKVEVQQPKQQNLF